MKTRFEEYDEEEFSLFEKRLNRAAQRRVWQSEVANLLEEEEMEYTETLQDFLN